MGGSGGPRRFAGIDEDELEGMSAPRYSVELPWSRASLVREAPGLAAEWTAGVRTVMRALLATGYVGTAVLPDSSSRRSFVVFERAATTRRD